MRQLPSKRPRGLQRLHDSVLTSRERRNRVNALSTLKLNTMYTSRNFRTKKAVKEAIDAGIRITVYQPNDCFGVHNRDLDNGTFTVEGPHYPEPHKWYGTITMKDGWAISIK
jgi:hypothetical protein